MIILDQANITLKHTWLCYSLTLNKIYCRQCCWLFSTQDRISSSWVKGNNDWRHPFEYWGLNKTISEKMK